MPECAQKGRFRCLVKFAQITTVYNSFNGHCLYDLVKIVEFSENSEEGGIFKNYTWIVNKLSVKPPNHRSGKDNNDITMCFFQQWFDFPYQVIFESTTNYLLFRMWLKRCQVAVLCFFTFFFWATTAERQQVCKTIADTTVKNMRGGF